MRVRNRLTLLLAMPICVFFWFFSWSLYWIGSTNDNTKSVERKYQEDLTFEVLTRGQQYSKILRTSDHMNREQFVDRINKGKTEKLVPKYTE